jgi:hypothetical protein
MAQTLRSLGSLRILWKLASVVRLGIFVRCLRLLKFLNFTKFFRHCSLYECLHSSVDALLPRSKPSGLFVAELADIQIIRRELHSCRLCYLHWQNRSSVNPYVNIYYSPSLFCRIHSAKVLPSVFNSSRLL